MAETVVGLSALHARFHALESADLGKGVMAKAAAYTKGRMTRNMLAVGARKTGGTAGSIHPRNITETSAQLWGSRVLLYIDQGTGVEGPLHHRITPKAAKVLARRTGAVRLTGASKVRGGTQLAGWAFAKSTKGMAPRPYIQRSIQEAGQDADAQLSGIVVTTWNDAA
jgi:hypothetical protein